MALHSLYCADVPLRNCSLTHSLKVVAGTRRLEEIPVSRRTNKE